MNTFQRLQHLKKHRIQNNTEPPLPVPPIYNHKMVLTNIDITMAIHAIRVKDRLCFLNFNTSKCAVNNQSNESE